MLSWSKPECGGDVGRQGRQLHGADIRRPVAHLQDEARVQLREGLVRSTSKLEVPIVEQEAGSVAMALDPTQVVPHRGRDASGNLTMSAQLGEKTGLVLGDRLQVERGRDVVLAAGKVVIETADAHARPCADVVRGCLADAAFQEQRQGGVEDVAPSSLRPYLTSRRHRESF